MKPHYLLNLKRVAMIACLFAFVACDGNEPQNQPPVDESGAVTGVTLSKTKLTLLEGAQETLTADVQPANATYKTVTWSIDKPEIASVKDGLVTAIAEGTAIVTVKTVDGGLEDYCAVTVNKEQIAEVRVTGVELNKNELTLVKGLEETLIATISPAEATNKNVTWSSSNPNAVSVNSEGKLSVTAMESGEPVTITVKTVDGGFEDDCVVTVTIPVVELLLEPTAISLEKDNTTTLTATIVPGTATNQNVTWATSDSGIATIAPDGLTCVVTAVAAGSASITVKTLEGDFEVSCAVTVTALHPIFGTLSFRSATTKTVGNQIWSDVVMGSGCPTEGFDSGYQSGPKVACRNVEGYGTFFSWPAVDENKGILCPDGWRVPTADDFTALNTAIGGTLADYQNDWGAEFGGSVWNGGFHATVGTQGKYWSQTSRDAEYAYYLHLQSGNIVPNQSAGKNYGQNLRCVKDAN